MEWILHQEITVKRQVILNGNVDITDEDHVDLSKQSAKLIPNQKADRTHINANFLIKAYVPHTLFLQRLEKKKLVEQLAKFLDIFRKIHFNIPLFEGISQILSYVKFLNEMFSKKRRLNKFKTRSVFKEKKAI